MNGMEKNDDFKGMNERVKDLKNLNASEWATEYDNE